MNFRRIFGRRDSGRKTARREGARRRARLEPLEARLALVGTPQLVSDILPGLNSSAIDSLTDVNGILYFVADNGITGRELWKTDGTTQGTVLVKDIREGPSSSGPSRLRNVNGTLYFTASDGISGLELWRSNGTSAGTVLVKDIRAGASSSGPQQLTAVGSSLFFIADDGIFGRELWKSNGSEAGTTLVKDIYPGSDGPRPPYYLTDINGTLYFSGHGATTRSELWKSDGTWQGTFLVEDINPLNSSYPTLFTNVNGTVYFVADDGANGRELWKSDGTAAGTELIQDINPGLQSGGVGELTNVNGTLFFRADDGQTGSELWKSDGTAQGTTLIRDVGPGSSGGAGPRYLVNHNGTLFYSAHDGVTGYELWKSDGTANGTNLVKDVYPGSANSEPLDLTVLGSAVYFNADNNTAGRELWVSDGTMNGTVLVADLWNGPSSAWPSLLTASGDRLFFTADNGTNGRELWVLSSSGPIVAADDIGIPQFTTFEDAQLVINAASGPAGALGLGVLANDTGTGGTLTLTSAANLRGTLILRNDGGFTYTPEADFSGTASFRYRVNNGSGDSNEATVQIVVTAVNDPSSFVKGPDVTVDENSGGRQFAGWATAISRGPANESGQSLSFLVTQNTNPSLFSSAPTINTTTGDLSFTLAANQSGIADVTVVLQDNGGGNSLSTPQTFRITVTDAPANEGVPQLVLDMLPGSASSGADWLTDVNGTLYFVADDGIHGREIWKTDGTQQGTVLVKDLRPGPIPSNPSYLENLNGTLYFAANDGASGIELWKSDGTDAGTVLVKDIRAGITTSEPRDLTAAGNLLYFTADDQVSGRELYRSDGTQAGTFLLRDIQAGFAPSNPEQLIDVNGTLFFRANSPTFLDLWKSNGTTQGTVKVYDLPQNPNASNFNQLTSVNGMVYFSFGDGINGIELWKSDGTAAGTRMVQDLYPGAGDGAPAYLTNVNGTLYFVGHRPSGSGNAVGELWKSDGTTQGTVLVKPANRPNGGGTAGELVNFNGTVFFWGLLGPEGRELWKSDGTTQGTVLVKDINPGPAPSYFSDGVVVGNRLYFLATTSAGTELWRTDGTTDGTVLVADLRPGGASPDIRRMTASGDKLFFTADNGTYGRELWVVADLTPIVASDDLAISQFVTPEDMPLVINAATGPSGPLGLGVLANDTGTGGSLVLTVTNTANLHGTLDLRNDGTFTYTPEAGFNGTASFQYRVNNGSGDSNEATVQIMVTAVNDAPSFTKGADVAVNVNSGAQIIAAWATGIAAGPSDEIGQSLTFVMTQNSNPGLFSAVPQINPASGNLSFTPAAGATGQADITVILQDNGGGANTSAPQTFRITVTAAGGADIEILGQGQSISDGDTTPTASDNTDFGSVTAPGGSLTRTFTIRNAGSGVLYLTGGLPIQIVGSGFTVTQPLLPTLGPGEIATFDVTFTPTLVAPHSAVIRITSDDADENPFEFTVGGVGVEPSFFVREVTPLEGGFSVEFNRPANAPLVNLYDGPDAAIEPADVALVGERVGPVAGSLVWNASNDRATFIKSGAPLVPDRYTVTLFSRADGWIDTAGHLLDGNLDEPGADHYVTSFTVSPHSHRLLSAPDFVRGPSQAVHVPNTAIGIPLTLSNGAGVLSVDVDVIYDPALLSISGVTRGAGAPATWSVTTNLIEPGRARITSFGVSPLPAGAVQALRLIAEVPATAPLAASHVVRLENVRVNGGLIAAQGDAALAKVAFLADVDQSLAYTAFDAAFISRVVVGLDAGFDAYPITDPVIIGNSSGTGSLSGLDAAYVAQKAVHLPRPEIPDLPANLPAPSPVAPDPVIGAPAGIMAQAGQTARVPIGIDNLAGLYGATVTVAYATSLLDLANERVTLGTGLEQAGWSLVQNVDDASGTARLVAYSTQPGSAGATTLFDLDYQVPPAASGATPIDLSGPTSDGGFSFTYIDGSLGVGLEGDLNADGRVGLRDLLTLRQHYGMTAGAALVDGNLDGDGDVDRLDLSRLVANYGHTSLARPLAVVTAPIESRVVAANATLRGRRGPTRPIEREAAVDQVLMAAATDLIASSRRRARPPAPVSSE